MLPVSQKIPARIKDILEKYLDLMLSNFEKDIEVLVLFGSWARGDARPDNDIDILCISSKEKLKEIFHKTSEFNYNLMIKNVDNRINLHFVPLEILDFNKDNEYVLLFYAAKEGFAIYGHGFWKKVKDWVLRTSYLEGYT